MLEGEPDAGDATVDEDHDQEQHDQLDGSCPDIADNASLFGHSSNPPSASIIENSDFAAESDKIHTSSPEDATGDDWGHQLGLQGTLGGPYVSEEASEGSAYCSNLYSPVLTNIDRNPPENSCSANGDVDARFPGGASETNAPETTDNIWDSSDLVVLPYQLVKQSIDIFFNRQFLPFSAINRDLFVHDFHAGKRSYCSPALLRSICCLSCRILGGYDSSISQHAALGSRLFDETARLLSLADESKYTIPDAQALGLLSLHQLGLGEYAEARDFADESVRRIDFQYRQENEERRGDSPSQATQATNLFGAISLAR